MYHRLKEFEDIIHGEEIDLKQLKNLCFNGNICFESLQRS